MSGIDLIAAWQRAAESASTQYVPFPAAWINQFPDDVADELKSIAAMCDEAHKIMADAATLLRDVLQDRLSEVAR